MFLLVPAGPDPELDRSPAHLIGRGNDLGQATGDAEGDWRYEGAEPDASGLAREAGEGRPRVGRGSARFTRKRAVVVGSEVRFDACLFGGSRQGPDLRLREALLGVAHQRQAHALILALIAGGLP